MRKTENTSFTEAIQNLFESNPLYSTLPPEYIILDEFHVLNILNISARKLAYMRSNREIEFHPTGKRKRGSKKLQDAINSKSKGKRAGKIYYTLKGVIDYVKTNTVTPIYHQRKI